jgi:hypothetical protein
VNRPEWIDSCSWRDPDCVECGGEGAPCCEPPDHPPPDMACQHCASEPAAAPVPYTAWLDSADNLWIAAGARIELPEGARPLTGEEA